MSPSPELSIVIVNWNNASYLKGCIQSILVHIAGIDFEIIVVDNASSDNSVEMVQSEFGHLNNLILIANPVNENYARGNNQGYERASGRYIGLLNPDTVVQAGMFQAMLAHLKANPAVGLVGPIFLLPDGAIQRINRRFPTWYFMFFSFSLAGKVIDRFLLGRKFFQRYIYGAETYSQVTDVDQVATACALLPRTALDAIGGLFDEQFPLFFNDVDLCKRLALAGFKIQVIPAARVTHFSRQGVQLLSQSAYSQALFQGMGRYFRKYNPPQGYFLAVLFPKFGRVWFRP